MRILLFFDISKAFDKVWHAGLMHKLKSINTPQYILNWIRGFIKNRLFYVKINNSISAVLEIIAGVSQGAILSPMLFNIYINDITIENKKHKSFSLLYADDLTVSFITKKIGKRIESQ
ncbi:MAG: reverse transcriptase domain-containing protein, partial [Flammeovirgaceae bacterium]